MPEPSLSVFEGLLTRLELAAQMRCTDRTIIRHERAGMPFIAVGKKRLYEPAKVRDWILSHESRPEQPKRGRPRKVAA